MRDIIAYEAPENNCKPFRSNQTNTMIGNLLASSYGNLLIAGAEVKFKPTQDTFYIQAKTNTCCYPYN